MRTSFTLSCLLLVTAACSSTSLPLADGERLVLTTDALVVDVDLRSTTLPPGWRVETGTWTPTEDGLVGAIDGRRAAAIWCDVSFPYDVAIRFEAEVLDGHDNDANAFFRAAGSIYGPGEVEAWIVGIAGWYQHDDGLEKHPSGPAERVAGTPLQPGSSVDVVAGAREGRVFLFKDGERRVELADPEPLAAATHDRVGLGTWDSTIRFTRLRVYRLD